MEDSIKRMKRLKAKTGRKYLQTTDLTIDLYLEYTQNSPNSIVENQFKEKMGQEHEETCRQSRYMMANTHMKRC